MLIRDHIAERRVWATARLPTPEQDGDRRLRGELERLRHERPAPHGSALCLYFTPFGSCMSAAASGRIGGCGSAICWHPGCVPRLTANVSGAQVGQKMPALEVQQDRQVPSGAHVGMALLARLADIGTGSALTLVRKLFGR
jgi:transposase